jgi:hypothetical protein
MSAPKLIIVKDSSVTKPLQITENGEAKDCSGLDISLHIERYVDGAFAEVEAPPTVEWTTAAEGKYDVIGAGALEVGNYYARVGLTNGADELEWVPNKTKPADLWVVVPIANR